MALTGGGATDPTKLAGHHYGETGTYVPLQSEPWGFVYTTNAGLVDLGHVRDNADETRYIFASLLNKTLFPPVFEGVAAIPAFAADAGPAQKKMDPSSDPALAIDIAGAIDYTVGLAHELETWEAFGPSGQFQDAWSAFSPEDLPSNTIGIELAKRVLAAGAYADDDDYNNCVDTILPQIMQELNAQPEKRTSTVLEEIAHGWFFKLLHPTEQLRRRNFDAVPWIAWSSGDPEPVKPSWLNSARFQQANGGFIFVMNSTVSGSKVPPGTFSPSVAVPPQLTPQQIGGRSSQARRKNRALLSTASSPRSMPWASSPSPPCNLPPLPSAQPGSRVIMAILQWPGPMRFRSRADHRGNAGDILRKPRRTASPQPFCK